MGGANNRPNANHNNGHGNSGRMRRPQNQLNRQLESNGPESKVRGTALQLYERYKTSAREVQSSDRILAESFLQYAEHYYRLAAEYGAFDHEQPRRDEEVHLPEDQDHDAQDGRAGQGDGEDHHEDQAATIRTEPAAAEREGEPEAPRRETTRNGEQPSFLFDNQVSPVADAAAATADAADEPAAVSEPTEPEPKPARTVRARRTTAAKSADEETPATGRLSLNRDASEEAPAEADEESHTPAFLKVEVRRRRGRPRKDEAAPAADADADSKAETAEAVTPAKATRKKATKEEAESPDAEAAEAPAPRRRGRPRKTAVEAPVADAESDKETA